MHIRGQYLNEMIYQYIIVISGVRSLLRLPACACRCSAPADRARAGLQSVGFLYGAYMEDFGYCVYAWFAGCCLAGLVRRSASLSAASRPPHPPHLCLRRRSAYRSGASSTGIRRSGSTRKCWRRRRRRRPRRRSRRKRRTRRTDDPRGSGGETEAGRRGVHGTLGGTLDLGWRWVGAG